MKPLLSALSILILILTTPMAFAAKPIAKCVSAEGELTFTDYLCETEEPGHNPMLMNDSVINPSVRAQIPSVIRENTIAEKTLKSATSEAQSQCQQRFVKYFKRRHPSIATIPDVQFSQVVDQFINGNNISISLATPVEYQDNTSSTFSNIECTVQRFKTEGDWIIGFREK